MIAVFSPSMAVQSNESDCRISAGSDEDDLFIPALFE